MSNPLTDVFGEKPDVAPYIPTDFGVEQQRALTEDIGAFPDITQLGDLYQQYMLADLNKVMPGFSDLLASGTADAAAIEASALPLIKGEIPQDVKDQVMRSSAFQALQGGFQGSPMAGALTARDLGLTSLNLMNQGANLAQAGGNAAQRWAGLAEGTMLNPSSMLITPQQQAALTMQNNLYKQQTQQLQNNLNAAPDPVAKGISDTIINLVGAYLGKGGGGGGTAPNYSPTQYAGQQQQYGVANFGGASAQGFGSPIAASGASAAAPTPQYQSNVNLAPLNTPGELSLGSTYYDQWGSFDPYKTGSG